MEKSDLEAKYGVKYEFLEYPIKVLNDEIVAGNLIKLSCKRYLELFENDEYYFSEAKALKVINFIERLKLTTGKFAGQSFKLSLWQKWALHYCYGFLRKKDDTRVVRQCLFLLSRKSGKSALASALGLYHLIADGEMDNQVIFAANSAAQAQLAFTMAYNYVSCLDSKGKYFKKYRDTIKFPPTKSIMKIISADASKADGLNCGAAILDEYHAAKNDEMSQVLTSSMGMRTQPMMIYITSAGFDLTSPCYTMRNTCIELLYGRLKDDSLAAFIYELDEKDNVEDPKNWLKCQPNLGITVTEEFLKSELNKAKNNPTLWTNYLTKLMNKWVASSQGEWIPSEYILKSTVDKVDLNKYRDEICYIGLDLSSVSDMTAISVLVFDSEKQKYLFKNYYFLPESALKESSNREKYKTWKRQKYLYITPGNVIDYDYILKTIVEINNIVPVQKISYDQWQSTAIIVKLTEMGFMCTPFSQTAGSLNRPTRHLEMISRNGQLVLDDNPITRWMFSNVVLKEDYNNNIKPVKVNGNSEKKIDGIAAILDALGCYLTETHYDNVIEGFSV